MMKFFFQLEVSSPFVTLFSILFIDFNYTSLFSIVKKNLFSFVSQAFLLAAIQVER